MGICGSNSKVHAEYGKVTMKDHIFMGDSEGSIYSWCCDSEKPPKVQVFKAHEGPIKSQLYIKDKQILFSQDLQSQIKEWDTKPVRSFGEKKGDSIGEQTLIKDYGITMKGRLHSAVFTNNSKYQIASDDKGYLKQQNIEKQEFMKEFSTDHSGFIYTICSNNNSKVLFSGDDEGKVKQWNVLDNKDFELVNDWNKVHKNSIYAMCLTENSKFLFTSDETDPSDLDEDKRSNLGNLKRYNVSNKETSLVYERNTKDKVGAIKCMTLSNDGNSLFVTDSEGNIEQWSTSENKLIHDFGRMHKFGINGLVCHQDKICTCDNKGGLLITSVKTKEKVYEFSEICKNKLTALCIC